MRSGWTGKRVAALPRSKRQAHLGVALTLVTTIVIGLMVAVIHLPRSWAAPPPNIKLVNPALSGTSYGANHNRMQNAANAAAWPQQNSQWCGIATVAAIGRYQGSQTVTQSGVANYLNSDASVSVWGTPSRAAGYWGPGFRADISRDFGTDPRSLTVGMYWATGGGHYHQFSASDDAWDASIRLARDLEQSGQPISVFVDHGLHSVVVSAVFSTTDPAINPSGITGFEVWDPGWSVPNAGIQPDEFDDVPLNTWLGSTNYWGAPYNANTINGYTYDPDPAVGPYAYNPSVAGHDSTLWTRHYVYVRPDSIRVLSARASVDWPFNQNGQAIKGFSGEIPPGYLGSTAIWEGRLNTLGSTTGFSPAFSARGAYDPAAAGSVPAAALAFTGTDSAHHVNIRTSQDGLSYSANLVLAATSSAAPAVLVAPPVTTGGQNVIIVAWDGTDTNHSLNVLYDAYNVTGQTQSIKLTQGSQSAPSLAWFNGQVWLAWTNPSSAHAISVMPMGSQGVTPGQAQTLYSAPGASGAPSLAVDAQIQSLVLSWAALGTNIVTYQTSTDGVRWTPGATLTDQAMGGVAFVASLAQVPGGRPGYPLASAYLIWMAPGGDLTARPLGQKLAPGETQLLLGKAAFAPAASYMSGPDVIFLWTGTDSAHHISAARAQM